MYVILQISFVKYKQITVNMLVSIDINIKMEISVNIAAQVCTTS